MKDPRIEKLADMLVNYSVAVKPGQNVFIRSWTPAEPLLREVYVKVLQAGGNPYVYTYYPGMEELFFKNASDEQIKNIPAPFSLPYETYDVMIVLLADTNTKSLSHIDPNKVTLYNQAKASLMRTYLDRASSGELVWTLALYPTDAYAQDAEMSLTDFEDFVYSACLPDMNDPIGYWKNFSARQDKIINWIKGKDLIHIKGKETDLTLSVKGRRFINSDGKKNVPDGEIFTGPVENSANGMVYFSYPAIYQGREVTGVRLWFENGKVVKATAEKNEDFLLKTLDTDAGSRYLGEFAIGTNESINRFIGQILFDEKIGGSFHMALGAGYPETGSISRSAIHWDMICDLRDGGEIWADDQLLYKNGRFVVDFS